MLDEFANIGQIPNFEKLIATIRSREISVNVILQAQSQLKAIYNDNMDTIIGNCDTTLFLGGKEKTTLKEMSDILGKETIHLLNTGESRGQSSSYSMNYQSLGKELMSMDEISVMDGSKCILQVRGVRPFLSSKYDIEKHPNYKYLADFNSDFNFNITDFVNAFKEDKAKLLEGVNKKNTRHIVIEIDEDEDTTDAAADTSNVEIDPANPEPAAVSDTEVLPTEPAEPTNQDPNQDNKNDNSYNEEDEDDTDDFDPNDTELV